MNMDLYLVKFVIRVFVKIFINYILVLYILTNGIHLRDGA